MTNIEITQNFIENLEKAREELGWTQAQMAEKLQMSLSSYKYMISGKSAKIPIYVAYLVYQTTGKFFFELCGDIVPEMSLLMDYRQLSKERQQAIRTSIAMERAIAAQSPEAIAKQRTRRRNSCLFTPSLAIWKMACITIPPMWNILM